MHIHDCAGVAHTLGKYQQMLGHDVEVLTRLESNNNRYDLAHGIGTSYNSGVKMFVLRSLIKSLNYDIIHLHEADVILKYIPPKKKVVMHYHGNNIRGMWNTNKKWKRADKVIVSTPDLLEGAPEEAEWIPNPIDTNMFKNFGDYREPNSALHLHRTLYMRQPNTKWNDMTTMVNFLAMGNGLKLYQVDRDTNIIPHSKMPQLLNQYEYYFDIKRHMNNGKLCLVKSKTGLEALACGCKVIIYNGEVETQFPKEHDPYDVVNKVLNIYEEL